MTTTRRTKRETTMKRADQRSSITILVLGDGAWQWWFRRNTRFAITTFLTLSLSFTEGVGKSSLISTFVSRYFSEVVPGIMTRVRLPPDPHRTTCVTTIVDSQFGDTALLASSNRAESSAAALPRSSSEASSLAALLRRSEPHPAVRPLPVADTPTASGGVDSIVLVYDLDRPETFFRLENHWLPLIERCYNGTVRKIFCLLYFLFLCFLYLRVYT